MDAKKESNEEHWDAVERSMNPHVRCNHQWKEVGYWFQCAKCGAWQDELENGLTEEHPYPSI